MTNSNNSNQTTLQRLRSLILAVCAIALLICLIWIGRAVYVSAMDKDQEVCESKSEITVYTLHGQS